MALLAVEHLSFTYPSGAEPVLRDVSFTLEAGDFTVLLGATGSGKSTLLRCLKREIAPRGEMTGKILVDGAPLSALSARESACRIGLVGQRPEEQIVTDKVWHELALGWKTWRRRATKFGGARRKLPAFSVLRTGSSGIRRAFPADRSSF